jgi:hypothetical protein
MGIMDEQRYEWRLRQIFGPFIEELYTLLLVPIGMLVELKLPATVAAPLAPSVSCNS